MEKSDCRFWSVLAQFLVCLLVGGFVKAEKNFYQLKKNVSRHLLCSPDSVIPFHLLRLINNK